MARANLLAYLREETETRGASIVYATHIFDGLDGLFSADANVRVLTERAKRVHIGLHGTPEVDKQLMELFTSRGWRVRRYYPVHPYRDYTPHDDTTWGPIMFGDGVLSLENQRPPRACTASRHAVGRQE